VLTVSHLVVTGLQLTVQALQLTLPVHKHTRTAAQRPGADHKQPDVAKYGAPTVRKVPGGELKPTHKELKLAGVCTQQTHTELQTARTVVQRTQTAVQLCRMTGIYA
jgi:hypothetical protein